MFTFITFTLYFLAAPLNFKERSLLLGTNYFERLFKKQHLVSDISLDCKINSANSVKQQIVALKKVLFPFLSDDVCKKKSNVNFLYFMGNCQQLQYLEFLEVCG